VSAEGRVRQRNLAERRVISRDVEIVQRYVPPSVREGGWRARLRWRSKLARESVALRLAPWLRGGLAPRSYGTLDVKRDEPARGSLGEVLRPGPRG